VVGRIQNEYGLESGKARFVGTGPGDVPPPVEPVTYENFLVMIAADFERKGGRLAAEAVAAARRLGCAVSIKFIGAQPPVDVLKLPFVEWCGWLDLAKESDRKLFAAVMSRAGAQMLLSRADLTPLAIPEAATYSKATIATAVGGVPEMIRDAETGWLVAPEASAREIGCLLARLFSDPGKLVAAGLKANRFQRVTWNWNSVAECSLKPRSTQATPIHNSQRLLCGKETS
jgi:glycosyltransferase involved in cell wall biosynthesis